MKKDYLIYVLLVYSSLLTGVLLTLYWIHAPLGVVLK